MSKSDLHWSNLDDQQHPAWNEYVDLINHEKSSPLDASHAQLAWVAFKSGWEARETPRPTIEKSDIYQILADHFGITRQKAKEHVIFRAHGGLPE